MSINKIKLSWAPVGTPGRSLHQVVEQIDANFEIISEEADIHATDTNNPHQVTVEQIGAVSETLLGAPHGVAELDGSGTVPSYQLPSYVDDVLEFDTLGDFPDPGEDGKIYVSKDANLTYRWTGTQYIEISKSIALGITASTAFRGDYGNTAYTHSQVVTGNPHNVTATEVGLGNVTNDAQLKASDLDDDAELTSNSDEKVPTQKAVKTYVDAHANDDDNPHGVTKAQVGLGNVTNDAQLKASDLDTDATLDADSDEKVPSQKAVKAYVDAHAEDDDNPHEVTASQVGAIPDTYLDDDPTLDADSDEKVPTQKAVKEYVDNLDALPVVGNEGEVLTTVSGEWAAAPAIDPLALRVVIHDDDPDVARPTAISVRWIGSVEPNNAIIGDEWVDNA